MSQNLTLSSSPLVIIIAGSKSDETHYQKIAEEIRKFEIETIIRIGSAHKTAEHVLNILETYEQMTTRSKVYVTVAGRSNALSGFVDGAVTSPVIACPPVSAAFGGADIFSSLRMPSGVSPAVVLEPANAAWLAVRILALHDVALQKKINSVREQHIQQILQDDAALTAVK